MTTTIIHADWSIRASKRWMAVATQTERGFIASAAQLWDGGSLFLQQRALLGVDFPIGLPATYANQAEIAAFVPWVPHIPAAFFDVADSADVISVNRPFYPMRPGGTKQQHLFDGLNVPNKTALMRICDRATNSRPAAESMFWTLGPKQVGKAMLTGWRELIVPNWDRLALWPFDGTLAELMNGDLPILAESYPGEFYHHLGLRFSGSKRSQAARRQCGVTLLAWAATQPIVLEPALVRQLADGFGPDADGEDPFDAVVGLFGMLNVLLGNRPEMPLLPPAIHQQVLSLEGWILGQTEYHP